MRTDYMWFFKLETLFSTKVRNDIEEYLFTHSFMHSLNMFTIHLLKQDSTTSETDIVSCLTELIVTERYRQAGDYNIPELYGERIGLYRCSEEIKIP